ncbi:MAG: acylneuraminate cytidylyltransferase family protein [Rhodospirillaceae bacterium]|nr:acylneuraminate cytidylyltransferase family protein [Rhodospirillaceae bacterium]
MSGIAPKDVIAVIPARGGSKGVPRKNIRPLLGKPLIAWTIDAALAANSVSRVIVSTDDHEIAVIARACGAEVPFMRPDEFAQDDTPDMPVLKHALEFLTVKENHDCAMVAWLRPTAPLRLADDIDAAIDVLAKSTADSVRSVSVSKAHPYWMKTLSDGVLQPFVPGEDEQKYPRRQALPPVYALNGAVDVMRTKTLQGWATLWGARVAGYVMPPERSVDIDTEADFVVAEALLRARKT